MQVRTGRLRKAGRRDAISAAIFVLLSSACATDHAKKSATAAAHRLAAGSGPAVPIDVVQPQIERMIASQLDGRALRILAVAGPVRDWLAVAVSPPYREFPTVVLFRSGPDGSWSRVFEALTPGVQPQHSSLLDLHTTGLALDFTIGEGSPITRDAIAKILSVSPGKGLVTVAHAYFVHSHPAGLESYFVDRTATYEPARRLFPGEYEKYPRTECTMFDVPALRRIDLRAAGEGLLLTAHTENGQTWMITWDGVDDQGLLTGKTVEAK